MVSSKRHARWYVGWVIAAIASAGAAWAFLFVDSDPVQPERAKPEVVTRSVSTHCIPPECRIIVSGFADGYPFKIYQCPNGTQFAVVMRPAVLKILHEE